MNRLKKLLKSFGNKAFKILIPPSLINKADAFQKKHEKAFKVLDISLPPILFGALHFSIYYSYVAGIIGSMLFVLLIAIYFRYTDKIYALVKKFLNKIPRVNKAALIHLSYNRVATNAKQSTSKKH